MNTNILHTPEDCMHTLGIIENPALLERLRRWLTNTYGSTATRCVTSLIEAQSLFITNTEIRTVITDLPPGQLLRNRYDEIAAFTNGRVRIVVVNNATSDIFVPRGDRTFSIVPEAQLERGLNRVLHVH